MNALQQKLLDMVQELDVICRAGEIEYYLSGGSVIGAIRHGGFIPWDDDIDILMTRENWEKFKSFAPSKLPANRALGCIEMNENFQNTIGRYSDTESTQVHKNELLGEGVAGIVIDIILLDRFDNTSENYQGYLKYLMLYSDIINKYYFYGMRLPHSIPYARYFWWSRLVGRQKVLDILLQKLLSYTSPEGDSYVVFWGGGPTVFPASVFQRPRYADFEGVSLPLPTDVSEFTRILYGDEWTEIPPAHIQFEHDCVYLPETPYRDFFEAYLPQLKFKKTIWDYYKYKLMVLKRAAFHNEVTGKALAVDGLLRKYSLEAKIEEQQLDIQALYKAGEYQQLYDLFSDYFEGQCSRAFLGGETWEALTRRFDPVYIPISDELLAVGLNLLLIFGRMGKAARILEVRKEKNLAPLTADLQEFEAVVGEIRCAVSEYLNMQYEAAWSRIETLVLKRPDVLHIKKMQVRLNRLLHPENRKQLETLIEEGLVLSPKDGFLQKEKAQILYEEEGFARAYPTFAKAFSATNHGIVRKEIHSLFLENESFLSTRAEQLLAQEKYDEAIVLTNYWHDVLPDSVKAQRVALSARIKVLNDAELEPLVSELHKLFRENPEDVTLSILYGEVLQKLERPVSYPYYQMVISAGMDAQQCAEAKAKFLCEEKADSPEALMILAKLEKGQGNGIQEYAYYREILMQYPTFEPVASYVLSGFVTMLRFFQKKKNLKIQQHLQQALRHKFPNPSAMLRWLIAFGIIQEEEERMVERFLASIYNGDYTMLQELLPLLQPHRLDKPDESNEPDKLGGGCDE